MIWNRSGLQTNVQPPLRRSADLWTSSELVREVWKFSQWTEVTAMKGLSIHLDYVLKLHMQVASVASGKSDACAHQTIIYLLYAHCLCLFYTRPWTTHTWIMVALLGDHSIELILKWRNAPAVQPSVTEMHLNSLPSLSSQPHSNSSTWTNTRVMSLSTSRSTDQDHSLQRPKEACLLPHPLKWLIGDISF